MGKDPLSAPRGLLRLIVLYLASKEPVSGVDIQRTVKEISEDEWSPSPGSVYYILSELESKRIVARIPTSTQGLQRYHSTERGLAMLAQIKEGASESVRRSLCFAEILSEVTELKFEHLVLRVAIAALSVKKEERRLIEPLLKDCASQLAELTA